MPLYHEALHLYNVDGPNTSLSLNYYYFRHLLHPIHMLDYYSHEYVNQVSSCRNPQFLYAYNRNCMQARAVITITWTVSDTFRFYILILDIHRHLT